MVSVLATFGLESTLGYFLSIDSPPTSKCYYIQYGGCAQLTPKVSLYWPRKYEEEVANPSAQTVRARALPHPRRVGPKGGRALSQQLFHKPPSSHKEPGGDLG